jgi:predicted transcriptional regulator
MRHSVSISLPPVLWKRLRSYCKDENSSGSEIVREALRDYFFRTEFACLRRKAMIEATRKGIHLSEEEIFRRVS